MHALAAASDLSTMAIRLALRLCVSFNCKTGQCDPGYRTLAKDMAVSDRSVFRAIAELEAGGWIAVDRTGGDNTRNNQFNLIIPGAQVTTDVIRSDDNMLSPEKPSLQVTKSGVSGDRKPGFQVTHSVAAHKPDEPENLKGTSSYDDVHASRVDSQSAQKAAHDEPLKCAPDGASDPEQALPDRNDPRAPPDRIAPRVLIGRPVANGDGVAVAADNPLQACFQQVLAVYPADRVGDEAKAFFACCRALDARGSASAVLDGLTDLMRSGRMPTLSEALAMVERRGRGRQPTPQRRTGGPL
jgi:hypothetical protein